MIVLNRYPETYEEEVLPQVIIEIRYRKGEEKVANLLVKEIEAEIPCKLTSLLQIYPSTKEVPHD